MLKKAEFMIFEHGSPNMVTFSLCRCSSSFFDENDQSIAKLVEGQQEIKLQLHVGAGWCVSITTGYRCVDIRKFIV
jgi:hypothetical protein